MSNQAVLNRLWSRVLLEELSRFGIGHICIAPGSRSTPLTLEADQNSKLEVHTHFDERGLGYFALGLAKALNQPIAIVVTSGTAVANLLPSIAEAYLTGEKLVVVTADRPIELVACGANQAIQQMGIFSHHVTQAISLPSPNLNVSLNWLLTTIDDVMFKQAISLGPVHINCPFPEPLYADYSDDDYLNFINSNSIDRWRNSDQTYCQQIIPKTECAPIPEEYFGKKGLIILGKVSLEEAKLAKTFAESLSWPLFADPQSGVTSDWANYDTWLQDASQLQILCQCDLIIQLGAQIISKRLLAWLEAHVLAGADYIYVSPNGSRNNQAHLAQTHYVVDIGNWIYVQYQVSKLCKPSGAYWANKLKENRLRVQERVLPMMKQFERPSEVAIAGKISQLSEACSLFIGNSLFIRLVDMFAQISDRDLFTNRGASGIDGNIATVAGIQRALQKPMIVFIGDTSLLHDLNSLALLSDQLPLVIVVINNDGGAIFNLLPIPEDKKRRLYQMPHHLQFEHAAKQFGLLYCMPESMGAYQASLEQHICEGEGAMIIEVSVPSEESHGHITQIVDAVRAG
ncbi:2-succinyl-5-enolpyruvyl-6-hydroxy-3-cyclohexene-1-carboxylic-acid synthase [Vibrio sp. S4M6]|uniref:2-succinyl-5-enolpyruvyl-6-hydroxy-3- cyclohexene-1-carboxylic-acid synthase n=1 Tax=Vibrio sinus TaxID=2946865 RepID=UPI00202A03A8|nr:2-succinyl-5-enolpyruvyl-6-hydroxy-3-cyclohexene-1-carboxylic-acid synthase [Vibrio sinus]MCL9783096.1 2-succinyl-5-enolpyruvyl-6-hydroxy-3-cyclohexene-1-carboxylic-acid synthase [Vibrio sinus]